MAPPNRTNRPSTAPKSPVAPNDPPPSGNPGGQGAKVPTAEQLTALDAVLKKSGRVPTHPLTAKSDPKAPKPAASEVSPAQAKKSEGFRAKGQEFFKKGNYEKALEYYKMAYQANPSDANVVLGLAMLVGATGELLMARELYNQFLESNPGELEVHNMRAEVDSAILVRFQDMAPQVPADKQEEFRKTVQTINDEFSADQALLIAHGADQQIEDMKAVEKELAGLHDKPREEKLGAFKYLFSAAMDRFGLLRRSESGSLEFSDAKEGEFVHKELNRVVKQAFGVLRGFIAADSEPILKPLLPVTEAYLAVADGRQEDAIKAFESAREAGFKALGDGDVEKGERLFKEAKKLISADDQEGLTKLNLDMSVITLLWDASNYLKPFDDAKTRAIGLAVVDAWEENLKTPANTFSREIGDFGKKWKEALDASGSLLSAVPEYCSRNELELKLVEAVRQSLKEKKSASIKDALEDLAADGPSELRGAATAALSRDVTSSDPSVLGRLIQFSDSAKPFSADTGNVLLGNLKWLHYFNDTSKMEKAVQTIVSVRSEDATQRADAVAAMQ